MSEIELAVKFLTDYEHALATIYKEGDSFMVSINIGEDYTDIAEYEGVTIGDAIRKFYEAQEKEESVK